MSDFNLFEKIPEGFRLASEEDLPFVTLTAAQAFADYQYPVPTVEISYSALLKFNYEMADTCAKNALKNGRILTNDDFSAVLLLTPFEKRADYGVESLYENLKSNAGVEAAENMLSIFGYIGEGEKLLKLDEGTVFIDEFAVQTPRQGQKLGSTLMRKLFEECTKKNRDILLYTNTERNKDIYNHLGYKTIAALHEDSLNSDTFFLLWQSPEKEKARLRKAFSISSFYPVYFCQKADIESTAEMLTGLGFEKLHRISDDNDSCGYVMGNDKGEKIDVFYNPHISAAAGLCGIRIGVKDLNEAVDYAKSNGYEIESDIISARTSRSIIARSPKGLRCFFVQHIRN